MKTKDETPHHKETKDKEPKGKSNLVGRVKKVIKKSRRKLGEEKFEKELQRTIEFLAQLQVKLDHSSNDGTAGEVGKKTGRKSVKRVEKKTVRNEAKKAKPGKKSVKKPSGKGANKKGNGVGPKSKSAAPTTEPAIAPQLEMQSTDQQSSGQ